MVDPCLVTWQFFIPSRTFRARSTRGHFQSCSYILFLKNEIEWDTEIVKMLSTSGAENIQAISLNYMSNMMFTSNDTRGNYIYIYMYTFRENWDFVLIIIVQFMMSANIRIRYGLQIVFVCLYITPSHYYHCANLSVDIELMKCLPDIFCRVREKDWACSLSYPLFNIWRNILYHFTQPVDQALQWSVTSCDPGSF